MTVLLMPETMAEVDHLDPGTTLLAGGTDLLVRLRDGVVTGPLADISRLVDAPAPVRREGTVLRLSALAPLALLDRRLAGGDDGCPTDRAAAADRTAPAGGAGTGQALPALRAAIACFASAQIRNRATLGGNLANASPAGDTIPPLLVAGALARLRGPGGARTVPVASVGTGPRRTCLEPGEWIESIDVPLPGSGGPGPGSGAGGVPVAGFRKVAGRWALAITTVSLAWSWRRCPDGTLAGVRLAAGAVAPTAVRCAGTEAALEGRVPTAGALRDAVAALRGDIRPIDDVRASADYRRAAIAGVLTEALGWTGACDPREPRDSRPDPDTDSRRNR